jgi:hypothetical protein
MNIFVESSSIFLTPSLSTPSVVANNRAEFFLVGQPLKGEWVLTPLHCQFADHDLIPRC